ncbi:28S ribosomal protein S31, mitochondrial isoform X1 [Marmota marmota marmota]|uniref:Small ribosomal subunit protein mS31 n=1 Tax=Marmota marmota marmota TaxID=9994 RepID=A0A8C6A9J5_MARMA|nr:28S ribosomal protein S31, mitochondrial isoform X1 [Marmota marmota marmota]
MFPMMSSFLPVRPFTRLSCPSGTPEASVAAIVLLGAPLRTVRTKNNIPRYFGTSTVTYSKKDEQCVPTVASPEKTSENQGRIKENTKKGLLDIIKGMKVELSTVNVQTTKPPSRKTLKSLETIGRLRRTPGDAPKKGNDSLSPELVEAASAVADSLPFDKQTTKSELLRQLHQHEEDSRAQKDREKTKISNILSDMKIAKSAMARLSTRPEHQIQFDEGSDHSLSQEKTADLKKRKNLFKGKRLNIFDIETFSEKAPETETSPSIWDVEFAKQLAAVNEQPYQNGFEEMIQWTKEGKLWEFPVDNEAGFDDDGSEFHEHIFLDKHLEGFPKQGPIRHFMELVTCGLSKNPYLSVKQKVEHIEWFRNYFKEKRDILKENNIQFN